MAAAAKVESETTMQVSTGTITWTENLLGTDAEGNAYTGNMVDSVNDYLIMGPNNEVYMHGDLEDAALAFYVKETGDDTHNLQIAVRGLDVGMYNGSASTGIRAEIQYGIRQNDDTYAWTPLVVVTSATEQYYTIPYTTCPKVDGKYQVVLRVVGGTDTNGRYVPAMASYTSLKYNGLEIQSVGGTGEAVTMRYGKYGLEIKDTDGNWYSQEMTDEKTGDAIRYNAQTASWEKKSGENWVQIENGENQNIDPQTVNEGYPALFMLSRQMRATNVVAGDNESDMTKPEATEPEATEPEATEPEATEPEATEPEATEPEATEPESNKPNSKPISHQEIQKRLWQGLMGTVKYLMGLINRR